MEVLGSRAGIPGAYLLFLSLRPEGRAGAGFPLSVLAARLTSRVSGPGLPGALGGGAARVMPFLPKPRGTSSLCADRLDGGWGTQRGIHRETGWGRLAGQSAQRPGRSRDGPVSHEEAEAPRCQGPGSGPRAGQCWAGACGQVYDPARTSPGGGSGLQAGPVPAPASPPSREPAGTLGLSPCSRLVPRWHGGCLPL